MSVECRVAALTRRLTHRPRPRPQGSRVANQEDGQCEERQHGSGEDGGEEDGREEDGEQDDVETQGGDGRPVTLFLVNPRLDEERHAEVELVDELLEAVADDADDEELETDPE